MKMLHEKIIILFLSAGMLWGQEKFAELKASGDQALKKGDCGLALEMYEKASVKADTPLQSWSCILGKYNVLRASKKYNESYEWLKANLDNVRLDDTYILKVANAFAACSMWKGPDYRRYALTVLERAQTLNTGFAGDVFLLYYQASYIYYIDHKYDMALEMLNNIFRNAKNHPSNFYKSYLLSGIIREKQGNMPQALQDYREAVRWGQQVKYKYDYSSAVKAVRRLEK